MKEFTRYSVKLVKEYTSRYAVESRRITSPSVASDIIDKVLDLGSEAEEVFGCLALNTKNEVIGVFTISRGSTSQATIHPREVFKRAMLVNAESLILFHNHPSGDVTPSGADIETTRRLVKAGELLGIQVLDHLVVGYHAEDGFVFKSLKNEGAM